jgi:ABC-type phosphate/phosphonate transport system substrate-binding protein
MTTALNAAPDYKLRKPPRTMMRYWLTLFLLTFSAQSLAEKTTPLSLGIFPHIPFYLLYQNYAPLTEHLKQQLNQPVRLTTESSYQEFTSALTQTNNLHQFVSATNEEYNILRAPPYTEQP